MERKQMSPDGQLIRTTKLPFNACEYDYVLASFPNEFYQIKFGYETSNYSRMPVSPKDYASPVDEKNRKAGEMIEEWKYEWADIIKRNYELKLNFDYRTVDNSWVEDLATTYNSRFDEEKNAEQVRRIEEWVKWAKKNHVIIESKIISVEPSAFYYDSHQATSAYLEFRIRSCDNYSSNIKRVIFGDTCNIPEVELNKWYGGIFGCQISWYSMNPTGDSAGVPVEDGLWTGWQKRVKTGLMKPVKKSESSYVFEYID